MKIEDLIKCIEIATYTTVVHTPSNDYYWRPGDVQEETITFVDANTLLEELKKLQDVRPAGWPGDVYE